MGKTGEDKTQKRISVGRERKLHRKTDTWTMKSKAGTHSKNTSVPLGFLIRELLGIAKTAKEARNVINSGGISVNGVARKDYFFNVGLFDVLDIDLIKKRYRLVFDTKGRLVPREISEKGAIEKLSKVSEKRVVKNKQIMITTNEGYNFTGKDFKVNVGGTVKIVLPEKKITSEFAMDKGNLAYVVSGTHVGVTAKITEVAEGTMLKPRLIHMKHGNDKFMTVAKNVFVIGKDKEAVELGLGSGKNE